MPRHKTIHTELVGRVFGHLSVLKDDGTRIQTGVAWLCQCDCGKRVHIRTTELTSGRVTSCGHVQRAKIQEVSAADLARDPGSRPSMLTDKPHKNSHTGVRNVTKVKRHGDTYYRVFVSYKRKTCGGYHKTIEDAIVEREALRRKYWPGYSDKQK